MTKKPAPSSNSNDNLGQQRLVAVNAQYIKDLSFENPGAPRSLTEIKGAPKIDISVDVDVKPLQEQVFEVVLAISARAFAGDKTLFVCELSYGGVFSVAVPEEEKEPVLMIYCPGLLFPFARRVVADVSRDGGFPPLMLDPIDFAALYQQHKMRGAAKKS